MCEMTLQCLLCFDKKSFGVYVVMGKFRSLVGS
jgi:hypothetical protein